MKRKERVTIENLGCFKNVVDSQVVAGLLQKQGLVIDPEAQESDWLLINTCGFIQPAKEESISEILSALERKESGEIRHLAVFGCLVQRYHRELKENFPGIDLLWGVNDMEEFARAVAQKDVHHPYPDSGPFLHSHRHQRFSPGVSGQGFLKISEGCNMECSFCAIPSIRGPYRSRTVASLVTEARHLSRQGIRELNLISQNTTRFGKDRGKKAELVKLVQSLAELDFPWIRLLYLMPEEITEDLLELFSIPPVLPYFDLPFQHISPGVLQSMNRSPDTEARYRLVETIRQRFPRAVLRSTFIVGHPGESQGDFELLREFIRETRIERVGVFAFSREEGTPAFDMKHPVPPGIARDRREELMDISDRNLEEYNRSLVGQTREFLPVSPCPWDGESTIGRIASQAPEVDGFTVINAPCREGASLRPIRITGFQSELLEGTPPDG